MSSAAPSPLRRYYGASPTMTVESYHTVGSAGSRDRSNSYRRLSGGSSWSRPDVRESTSAQVSRTEPQQTSIAPAAFRQESYADLFLREEALKTAAASAAVSGQMQRAAVSFSECVQACAFIGMNHSTELLTIYSQAAGEVMESMGPRWKRAGLPPPRPPSEKSLLSPTVKSITTPTKGLMSPRPCPQSVSPPHHSPPPVSQAHANTLRGAPTPPPRGNTTSDQPSTTAPPPIISDYTPYARSFTTPQSSLDKVQSSVIRDRGVSSLLDAADQSVLKASLERDRERQALASTSAPLTGITGVTGVTSAYYNDPNLMRKDISRPYKEVEPVVSRTVDTSLGDLKDVSLISSQSFVDSVVDVKETPPPPPPPPHTNVNAVLDQVRQMEHQLGTLRSSLMHHLNGTHSKGTSPPMAVINNQFTMT